MGFEALTDIFRRKLDSRKAIRRVFDIKDLQYMIIDLNTLGQLYDKGVDALGNPLGQYRPYTLNYKQYIAGGLGRDTRHDHITLKDTGKFYDSVRVRNNSDSFLIVGETIRDGDDLQKLFGKNILGLSNESMEEIKPAIVEYLIEDTRKAIAGKGV